MDPIFFMFVSKWLMGKTIFEIGLALQSGTIKAQPLKVLTQMKAARLHSYRNCNFISVKHTSFNSTNKNLIC